MSKRKRPLVVDSPPRLHSPPPAPAYAHYSHSDVNLLVALHEASTRERVEEQHKREIARLKAEHDEELRAAEETIRKEYGRRDEALDEVARLRRRADHDYETKRKLRREVDRLKDTSLSNDRAEKYEKVIAEQREKVRAMAARLETHNAALKEAVDKERQVARAEKGAQLQAQLDAAAKQFDEYETKVTALKADIDKERQAARAEKDECARLRSQLDAAAKQFAEYKAEQAEFVAAAETGVRRLCGAAHAQLRTAEAQADTLQAELDRLKQSGAGVPAEEKSAPKGAVQHGGDVQQEPSARVHRPSDRHRVLGEQLRSALGVLASGGERHSVEFVRMAALAVIKHSKAH